MVKQELSERPRLKLHCACCRELSKTRLQRFCKAFVVAQIGFPSSCQLAYYAFE
jgi:hypothetical protein